MKLGINMKKKHMKKLFEKTHIFIELFGISVYFTKDKQEFIQLCEWINVEPVTNVDGRTVLCEHEDGTFMIYVGLFDDNLGTLAHECVHASNYIAKAIGHDLEYHDEIIPYLTGFIFKKCQEKINDTVMV